MYNVIIGAMDDAPLLLRITLLVFCSRAPQSPLKWGGSSLLSLFGVLLNCYLKGIVINLVWNLVAAAKIFVERTKVLKQIVYEQVVVDH